MPELWVQRVAGQRTLGHGRGSDAGSTDTMSRLREYERSQRSVTKFGQPTAEPRTALVMIFVSLPDHLYIIYSLHWQAKGNWYYMLYHVQGGNMRNTEPSIGADRSRGWNYARQSCGAQSESKPEFCYQDGRSTVVPIERVFDGGSPV